MRHCFFPLAMMLLLVAHEARAEGWQSPPGHPQIEIWPGAVPDAEPIVSKESVEEVTELVAGRPWVSVTQVSRPTMTLYLPKINRTGAAVVVFPGGGYRVLAMDLEGTEVCDWLLSRGTACVLLKYRVPDSGPHWDPSCRCHRDAKAPLALQDAQRTLGLLRSQAARWQIDPHRIGVLGFSAGGHLVADLSTHWAKRSYRIVDAADEQSCRPDFAVMLYPGHMLEKTTQPFELNPTLPVSSTTPPTLLVHASDDSTDPVNNSLVYYVTLRKAGVPVELHLYAQGGHAFGLRATRFPITRWPGLVETWLATLGVISK